jgi:hypothetical protein
MDYAFSILSKDCVCVLVFISMYVVKLKMQQYLRQESKIDE